MHGLSDIRRCRIIGESPRPDKARNFNCSIMAA
jgi:hypothetical protein